MTPADCFAVAPFGIVHDLTSAGPPVKKVCNSKSSKLVRTILFNPDSSRLYSDKNIFSSSGDNKEILECIGSNIQFIQDNESHSKFGTIRGLHFQRPPHEQSKLIRVSSGKIQDVILDIRKDSETYGKHESYELSSDNNRLLFIPKGFAHGFLVLSQEAIVNYKVDNYYNSESEAGVRYNDPKLNINWNLSPEQIIVSDKDSNLPIL